MKVLLMTLQDEPPSVDTYAEQPGVPSEWVRKSAPFKKLIHKCLLRKPEERPTAEQLLKLDFFKKTKGAEKAIAEICEALPLLRDTIGASGDVVIPPREPGAGVATAMDAGEGKADGGGGGKGESLPNWIRSSCEQLPRNYRKHVWNVTLRILSCGEWRMPSRGHHRGIGRAI